MLKGRPPYHSVFGFTRESNEEAQKFYGKLGFDLTPVQGVYKDGTAIFFHAPYSRLLTKQSEYEQEQKQ